MELTELKKNYEKIDKKLEELWRLLWLWQKSKSERRTRKKTTRRKGVWDNKELRESVFSHLSNINAILENIISYKGDFENALDLIELLSSEQDEELEKTLETDYKELEEKVNQFEDIYLLFDNEYDENSCTIDIHSGAGGTREDLWLGRNVI